MAQATSHNIINRREALASVVALAAVPAGFAIARAAPIGNDRCVSDPIFQLIEEHRAAYATFSKSIALEPDPTDEIAYEKWEHHSSLKGDLNNEATVALLTTAPTTLAGAVAMLRYLQNLPGADYLTVDCDEAGKGADALVSSLLAALAPACRFCLEPLPGKAVQP